MEWIINAPPGVLTAYRSKSIDMKGQDGFEGGEHI